MTPRFMAPLRSLAVAEGLWVRVSGECMSPRLQDGALVPLTPAAFYWPGDVVAFLSGAGRLVAHRVVGYHPGRGGLYLWTQADSASRPDAPVAPRFVLGRVALQVSLPERWRAVGRLARHLLSRLRERTQRR
jgi:hypothetical protein